MSLEAWGWDERWANALDAGTDRDVVVARVTGQDRGRWSVQSRLGPGWARLTTVPCEPSPVVGDWVELEPRPEPGDPWSLRGVLPRRTQFARGAAGGGASAQVLAANVDRVWVVQGLDLPPNLRRIERYLALAWESGASPEIVLTKSDLAADVEGATASVESVAVGVPIRRVSSEHPESVRSLRETLRSGKTVVLLGPSGAGKSTLINLLAEAELTTTGAVRARDGKGRHTTTRRSLFRIPGGALLLDTPGIRELRVWELDEGLDQAFPEIDELAQKCRFRDCTHDTEPGCAVLEALASGRLDADRMASYRKLRAEAAWQERKLDPRARAAAVSRHKTAMKSLKYHPKYRKEN